MYLGFDLLGKKLRYCEAAPAALREATGGAVQQVDLGSLAPLLVEAERSLRVTGLPAESAALRDAEAQHAGGHRAWVRRCGEVFAPFRTLGADVRSIGLATAYATPPLVCQGLGALFAPRDRAAGAQRQRRVYACEAPLALALELVAAKKVSAPSALVLLTPGIEAVELTCLNLSAEGGDLRLEVRRFMEIPVGAEDCDALRGGVASVCDAAGGNAGWFIVDEAAADLPAGLAASIGGGRDALQQVSGDLLAWGAARYAAIHDKVASGTGFRGLAIERLAARPVGLVGCNRAGDGAWRLLMPAGRACDTPALPLTASSAAGGIVVLAELARSVAPAPLWLSQSDWETRPLVVHATCRVPRPPAEPGTALQIQRSRPSGLCIWSGNEFSAHWISALRS